MIQANNDDFLDTKFMVTRIGRPPKNKVDSLRTKFWYAALSDYAGGRTPYGFNKFLENKNNTAHRLAQSTIEKYRNGERNAFPHCGKDPVAIFAEYFPGTDQIFKSNIWTILKSEEVSQTHINVELSTLEHTCVRLFLDQGWFIKATDGSVILEDLYAELSKIPNLTTLKAIVLLMGSAKITRDRIFWNSTCELYRLMLPEFLLSVDIYFKAELFNAIDKIAQYRDPEFVNVPKIIPESWTEQIPAYKKLVIEHYMACLGLHDGFFPWYRKLPKTGRRQLARDLVEFVWQSESLKYNCLDLWKPLASFFIDESQTKQRGETKPDQELKNSALSTINKYMKKELKLKKGSNLQAQELDR